jgi:hypothetical protein
MAMLELESGPNQGRNRVEKRDSNRRNFRRTRIEYSGHRTGFASFPHLSIVDHELSSATFWQAARTLTSHGLQESVLIDKRNLDNSLPILLLSIHIQFKLFRVEIVNWRSLLSHQILISAHCFIILTYPISSWNMFFTVLRQDTHQLLEGSEGGTELEIKVHLGHLYQIYPSALLALKMQVVDVPVSLGAK